MSEGEINEAKRRLTVREEEVVNLSAKGMTPKAISDRLALAETTVRDMLARLAQEFDCPDIQVLAARASGHRATRD